MASENPEAQAVCIYCLHVSDGTGFNREHLIPQSICGTLFVDNMVCERCNSDLGREVDCEILKVPEILTAMGSLGVPFDRKGVLRNYYDASLVSDADRLRATPTDDGFKLITQDLEDGSRITPGHELAVDTLHCTLSRDKGLREAGVTGQTITESLSDLKESLKQAEVGEEVKCDVLGLTVIKRSEQHHVEATPKSKASVDRAIAKIAFEWMFSCFGRRFIEAAEWITDLRNLVCGCDDPSSIHIFRSEPIDPEIRMTHSIYVYLHPSYTKVAVGLFGGVEYTMIAPCMNPSVLDDFKSETSTPDAIGVAFQQDLAEAKKHFFALCDDGSSKYLGEL